MALAPFQGEGASGVALPAPLRDVVQVLTSRSCGASVRAGVLKREDIVALALHLLEVGDHKPLRQSIAKRVRGLCEGQGELLLAKAVAIVGEVCQVSLSLDAVVRHFELHASDWAVVGEDRSALVDAARAKYAGADRSALVSAVAEEAQRQHLRRL